MIFLFACLTPGSSFAQEESITPTDSVSTTITLTISPAVTENTEVTTIPSLILDLGITVPEEKIVPKPTPKQDNEVKNEDYNGDQRSWTKFKYHQLIWENAQKYLLDPQVIYATIMTESEGDEYAYRWEPYLGEASLCMGQVLVSTARNLGFEGDPFDMYKPEVCINLIGKYHRNMLDTFGELTPLQLATAYNAGSPWRRPVPGHLFRFSSWYNETMGG